MSVEIQIILMITLENTNDIGPDSEPLLTLFQINICSFPFAKIS